MDKLNADLLAAVRPRRDGDVVDRLNSTYSTILLVIFSAITSMFTFGKQPLQCWYPAYFKRWWIEYANDFCYVQNTYFIPITDPSAIPDNFAEIETGRILIPHNLTERYEGVLPYYQWVPFILAFQAVCFFIPLALWRSLKDASGLCVSTILKMACKDVTSPEKRTENLKLAAKYLNYHDTIEHELCGRNRAKKIKAHGFVFSLYLFVKFFYFFNAVAQFFLLTEFLGFERSNWGFSILRDMSQGIPWTITGKFPRVTLCDFRVRVLANLHRHTVQCVLMVNMFNEKFFVFLWWWLLLMSLTSIISLVQWAIVLVMYEKRTEFILNYLLHDPKVEKGFYDRPNLTAMVQKFIRQRLHPDGVLLLKLVQCNAGDVTAGELTRILWEQYMDKDLDYSMTQSTPVTPSTTRLPAVEGQNNRPPSQSPEMAPLTRSPPPRYEDSELEDTLHQTTEL